MANSTGWSEDYILWELPLERGLQYQHSILVMNGAVTVASDSSLEDELAEVIAEL